MARRAWQVGTFIGAGVIFSGDTWAEAYRLDCHRWQICPP
jgi:hypothetical protein